MAITKETIQLKKEYLKNPRACLNCEKELEYKRRHNKFCGNSCAAIFNNKRRERNSQTNKKVSEKLKDHYNKEVLPKLKEKYLLNPSFCKGCNQLLTYEERKQKYCSSKCHNNSYKIKEKIYKKSSTGSCINCGSELYKGFKYCNIQCQQNFEYNSYIKKWLSREIEGGISYGYVSKYIRRYLISLHGDQCWQCGWNQIHPVTGNIPIHIDHIDGDCRNNSPDNLRLLCPNCHSLTPTFGALNKNGRGIGIRRNI